MIHPSDDKLLEYSLEVLDQDERDSIRTHIQDCTSCSEQLESITDANTLISGIDIDTTPPDIPIPLTEKRRHSKVVLLPSPLNNLLVRGAALLLVGFLGGYGVAALRTPGTVEVVPPVQVSQSLVDTTLELRSCEVVDLGTYYGTVNDTI